MLTQNTTKNATTTQSQDEITHLIYSDIGVANWLSACPVLATPIAVTTFTDRRGFGRKTKPLNLIGLATMATETPAASKEAQSHFKLGRFGKVRSEKGSYRTNANHLSVTGIEGDYDAGTVSLDQAAGALAEAGVAALLYSSARHGMPGLGHRWRVVCPLSTETTPEERAAFVARVNGVLGGILASESFGKAQSFGFGHVKGRNAPEVRLIEGRFIDQCDDLDAGAIGKPTKATLGEPEPAVDQSGDHDAVANAKRRLEAVATCVASWDEGDRNSAINKAAFELGGLVACATLEKAELIEVLTAAADECGYCQDYGEDEAIRVIESGLREGMKRPTPYVGLAHQLDDLPEETDATVGTYAPDQDGAIQTFTDRHRDGLRFDFDRNTWLEFDGNTWRPERTDLARDFARQECMKLAKRHEKDGKGLRHVGVWEAVERGARSVRDFAVTSTHWDRDPLILGTPEGVVDLATGEVRAGRPEDEVSKRTAVHPIPLDRFVAEVNCPQWLAFLDFALSGDAGAIRFLQQWAGMSLTGLTREQKLLFIHGGGGNGKGVAVNTFAWMAGDYAADVPSSTLTAKRHEDHPTELARLQGVRFAFASEVERGSKWAEKRIKSLTGGDPVTARFMRGDYFTFDPQLTLTVVGNDRPSFTAVDDAIRRRFLLLEMDRKPDVADPNLPEKLRAEGPGILTWMIEGALDWQRHGLVIPDVVRRATDDYMMDEDHFARFLAECCAAVPGARTATVDLHAAYETWAFDEPDAQGFSVTAFSLEMQRKGYQRAEKVRKSNGGRGKGFVGIQLHVESEEDQ